MKYKVLNLTAACCLLLVSGFTYAGLITDLSEKDWAASNDGLITYDASTGLEWLDLSVTRGNSILQTEGESFFGDFRWATTTELDALFDIVFDGSGYRSSTNATLIGNAEYFVALFSAYTGQNFSQGVSRGAVSGVNSYGLGYVSYNFNSTNMGVQDTLSNCCWSETDSGPNIGSWLVRSTDVPEPSTLAIFALGMIGLASRRFKK